ncbi:MAG TPA: serine hydrolase domain-containing protein [Candidatus Limnocylindrales bacterium]|nr:serine hydrolase domain-containing protein [Candidatus Limnocylindrales bacterium]
MLLDQVTNSLIPQALEGQDEQFQRAFAVLRAGIEQRAFPGACAAITFKGKLIAHKALGYFTYETTSPDITRETIFDLASVTKALATTAACMVLHEEDRFHLEQPVMELLPEFAANDASRLRVTLRMLLAHSSGLPAYIKLFQTARNRRELLAQALQTPLASDPGSRAEYSDIGFILLGEALERITGQPLDQFCRRSVFSPLNLNTLSFNPPDAWKAAIPPTENDRTFRQRIIQGEVNDENAYVMGGVAGHAGCFGNALDVAAYAECMLRGGAPLLQRHTTVGLFTQRQDAPPGTSRVLGWDTPSPPSQSGKYFSQKSYGHLGYTGTSLWIDPERRLSVTLLTNRTWPDRGSQGIKQIRPAFHDAVIEALD